MKWWAIATLVRGKPSLVPRSDSRTPCLYRTRREAEQAADVYGRGAFVIRTVWGQIELLQQENSKLRAALEAAVAALQQAREALKEK